MLDKLRSMAVFAKVVELGSFRRAAEALDLSASVVSHHVAMLEKQLDVTLLYRSTRHLSPTVDGTNLYEACRAMVQSAEAGLNALSSETKVLSGRLWMVVPGPFSSGRFLGDVAAFSEMYPQLQIRIDFDDRPRNMAQEGVDLAIRFGEQPDSSLVSRKLFDAPRRIFAAPAYLARHGTPKHPSELAQHEWVSIGSEQVLDMTSGSEKCSGIAFRSRVIVSNVEAVRHLARDGLGLIVVPAFLVQEELLDGRLSEVLPEWASASAGCYALYPTRVGPHAASRRFVDFLLERIAVIREVSQAASASRKAAAKRSRNKASGS